MKPPPDLSLHLRDGLPDALRVLADAYPRASWEGHQNFGELVRFWMDRHQMFRRLMDLLRDDLEAHLDGQIGFDRYAARLSRYAGMLLNELHAHHHIEDSHYFPKLIELDARIETAFDLLEKDHQAMDGLLHGMAEGAHAVLNGGQPGIFQTRLNEFEMLLNRHLIDEEVIVVPVVLHTGFRG